MFQFFAFRGLHWIISGNREKWTSIKRHAHDRLRNLDDHNAKSNDYTGRWEKWTSIKRYADDRSRNSNFMTRNQILSNLRQVLQVGPRNTDSDRRHMLATGMHFAVQELVHDVIRPATRRRKRIWRAVHICQLHVGWYVPVCNSFHVVFLPIGQANLQFHWFFQIAKLLIFAVAVKSGRGSRRLTWAVSVFDVVERTFAYFRFGSPIRLWVLRYT